jgi:nitrogen fixation protein FixH
MTTLVGPRGRRASIVPWLFPGGLALVVAVNMVLLWFALDTFPGVVAGNAYERGRTYGQVLERDAAIAALGWTVDVDVRPERGDRVVARYLDRDGKPIAGLRPRAVLSRPVGDPVRIAVQLREDAAGTYLGEAALPHRGLWDVSVIAGTAPIPHEKTVRVNLR